MTRAERAAAIDAELAVLREQLADALEVRDRLLAMVEALTRAAVERDPSSVATSRELFE